jgi:hypothetical protein
MQTVEASAQMPGTADEVWTSIRELARQVWSVNDCDVVDAVRPDRLVHGVVLDDALSCWLTWELSPGAAGATMVRVVHDELDAGPEPDLAGVLEMLRVSLESQRKVEET